MMMTRKFIKGTVAGSLFKRRVLVALVFVFAFSIKGISIGYPPKGGNVRVFEIDGQQLLLNKNAMKNGDERLTLAYKQLIKDADKALKWGPVSVMEKKHTPPSGDKHDYMSLAPYHWPDSSKPDGLPYIRKDGQTNPEVKDYKDKDYLPKLCANLYVLGLAYYFSDNEVYAEHASKLLQVWFLDTATRMNPNLKYAQAIKGMNDGRGAGLIDTRHFVKLVDAIGLIGASKYWKPAYQENMQQWCGAFLNWMQTSQEGKHEMATKNNHGVWYDAQSLALALFVDDKATAKTIVERSASRLDAQLDEKAFFPAEMERTISLHYSAFVMDAFVSVANMSEHVGINFWQLTTPSGKSLKMAFDNLKPYLADEKEWMGEQIKPYDFEDSYNILLAGSKKFKCRNCSQVVTQLAGDKAQGLKIWLLY